MGKGGNNDTVVSRNPVKIPDAVKKNDVPADKRRKEDLDWSSWVVKIHGIDVDVQKFAKSHPGGSKVLRIWKDRDATEVFESYHSEKAHKMLKAMQKKGTPSDMSLESSTVHKTAIGLDFQRLIDEMKAKGWYELSAFGVADELFKLALCIVPAVIGAYLVKFGTQYDLLGSMLMCFSFYMSGWVGHDYAHHSVFSGKNSVWWNNAFGRFLGYWQGYETGWWKARHNTHHICTNEHGNDPDIRTAPVFIFVRNSPKIAKSLNFIQRFQTWYYIPMLSILDFYWRLESLAFLLVRLPSHFPHLFAFSLHYVALAYIFAGKMDYMALMIAVRGFWTGLIVFATHYGEDILDGNHNMTLCEQTALTSRNITGGYLVNVLTGYISLQTEHHLFPMIPTNRLEDVQPLVKEFFKKHNIEYRESNIVGCVKYNIKALEFSHLLH